MSDDPQKMSIGMLQQVLGNGLQLLSPTTGSPTKNEKRFTVLMDLERQIHHLMSLYEHAADEMGE